VSIFVSHRNTDYTLQELAEFYRVGPSGITDICRRMKRNLPANATLSQSIREIERRVGKTGPCLRNARKTGIA
jgi:predicted DNA-binding protein YlxM (UPF0122 family)